MICAFKFNANVVEKIAQKNQGKLNHTAKKLYFFVNQIVTVFGLQENRVGDGGKRGKYPSKDQVDFGPGKGIAPFTSGDFPVI
jgi:hypothetical protein